MQVAAAAQIQPLAWELQYAVLKDPVLSLLWPGLIPTSACHGSIWKKKKEEGMRGGMTCPVVMGCLTWMKQALSELCCSIPGWGSMCGQAATHCSLSGPSLQEEAEPAAHVPALSLWSQWPVHRGQWHGLRLCSGALLPHLPFLLTLPTV